MKRNCAISKDSSCTQIILSNDDPGLKAQVRGKYIFKIKDSWIM